MGALWRRGDHHKVTNFLYMELQMCSWSIIYHHFDSVLLLFQ